MLATGSRNRILPMFPEGQPGIYYLRTADEALALKAHLGLAKSLILIGGGVVGLEIAASAAELGIKVTVIEIAPRILARVCDEETSAIIHQRHRDYGVDIRTDTVCAGLQALPDGKLAVVTKADETLAADLIVVGAGAVPDDALAKSAGLAVQDGILVDDRGRTSDPAIFAAGDCTRFTGPNGPVRLENWRHAQEHGAVAGRNAAGGDAAYNPVPSYWSEQYDLYIQGMGWPVAQPSARVRRKISDKATRAVRARRRDHRLCHRHQCAARHRDHPPADRAADRGRRGRAGRSREAAECYAEEEDLTTCHGGGQVVSEKTWMPGQGRA